MGRDCFGQMNRDARTVYVKGLVMAGSIPVKLVMIIEES